MAELHHTSYIWTSRQNVWFKMTAPQRYYILLDNMDQSMETSTSVRTERLVVSTICGGVPYLAS